MDISKPALDESRRTLAQAWVRLRELDETGVASTQPGPLCSYCLLAKVCPSSRAKPNKMDVKAQASDELGIEVRRTVRMPTMTQPAREPTMTNTQRIAAFVANEDKPFVEFVPGPATNGSPSIALNLNSYAASSVFGLSALAGGLVSGQDVIARNGETISALVRVLAQIEQGVAAALGLGWLSPQAGATSRIRGVLRSRLEIKPPPFGSDAEAWTSWAISTQSSIVAIMQIGANLWANGPGDPSAAISVLASAPGDPAPQS